MRRRDWPFVWAVWAALALPLSRALLRPRLALFNFGDIFAYHLPLRHLCASRILGGEFPFWNPYVFSGLPLFADPQAGTLYPGSVLFYLLPALYSFTLTVFLHMAWASLGMHVFLRREGVRAGVCAAIAAAFALSPMVVYRAAQGIPTHVVSLSWVPWCWLALRARRPALLGACWALQALGGHPEFAVLNALALLADAARRPGGLLCAGVGARWAAALSLVQVVPALEFIASSNRSGLPRAFFAAYSMPWRALPTLVFPGALGTPLDGSFSGPPSIFFETCAGYAGLVPTGLAAAAVLRAARRRELRGEAAFALGLAACGLVLALGTLSFLALSRAPARFTFLTVWGVLLAAAAGGERLCRRRPWIAAALLCGVLLDLGPWSARFLGAQDAAAAAPHPDLFRAISARPVRIATGPGLTNPNKTMLYRAMNVNGYAAYFLRRYASYAARAEGRPAVDASRAYLSRVDSPEIKRLGVVAALTDARRDGAIMAESSDVRLYANPGAYPLAYMAGPGCSSGGFCSVEISMPSAEAFSMRATIPPGGAESLVLAVPAYPGWRAWSNGRSAEVSLYDGLVQSVSLAGASGRLRAWFRFRPTAWPLLVLVSGLAWALWLGLLSKTALQTVFR